MNDASFVSFWWHECSRAFGDRLIEKQDQNLLRSILQDAEKKYFAGVSVKSVGAEKYFSCLRDGSTFEEVENLDAIRAIASEKLLSYNSH
ncbi:MAG: hypothetical protein AAGM67_19895, partial [Bacteroidota bacterium]